MDLEAAEVDARRLELAGKYAAEWDAVLVLKGAPTVIGCPDGNVYINTTGNSAMATGGSGDVLTGIIAGLAVPGDFCTGSGVSWCIYARAGWRFAR